MNTPANKPASAKDGVVSLRRVGKAILHPGRAIRAVGRRIDVLYHFLRDIDFTNNPEHLREVSQMLRQLEFFSAASLEQPLCIDLGDEALIVYCRNMHRYAFEDRFLAELFQQ